MKTSKKRAPKPAEPILVSGPEILRFAEDIDGCLGFLHAHVQFILHNTSEPSLEWTAAQKALGEIATIRSTMASMRGRAMFWPLKAVAR
jgi:hypothetical protein